MGSEKPSEKKPRGAPNADPQSEENQSPVHEVSLDPFFLSKYEMTQGQWSRFTGANPLLSTIPASTNITRLHIQPQ